MYLGERDTNVQSVTNFSTWVKNFNLYFSFYHSIYLGEQFNFFFQRKPQPTFSLCNLHWISHTCISTSESGTDKKNKKSDLLYPSQRFDYYDYFPHTVFIYCELPEDTFFTGMSELHM